MNKTGKGGFHKGDPRINRKGRPKSFDKLRSLTLDMLTQPAYDLDERPVIIDGKHATNIEVIVYQCIRSRDWRRLQYILEVAYGKTPDTLDIDARLNHSLSWKEFISQKDSTP